jgi:hypothetical protein
MPRGHGQRCAGFASADGLYARCTREEPAGSLELDERTTPPTYAHRLEGLCRCGVEHGRAVAAPAPAARGSADLDLIDAATRGLADAWESVAGSPIHGAALGRALLLAPYPDVAAAVLDVAALAAREPMNGHLAEVLIARELGQPSPRRHRPRRRLTATASTPTIETATRRSLTPRAPRSDPEADPSARSEAPDLAPCALGDVNGTH